MLGVRLQSRDTLSSDMGLECVLLLWYVVNVALYKRFAFYSSHISLALLQLNCPRLPIKSRSAHQRLSVNQPFTSILYTLDSSLTLYCFCRVVHHGRSNDPLLADPPFGLTSLNDLCCVKLTYT